MSFNYSGETPLQLMTSQAKLLEIKTNNLLRCEISEEKDDLGLVHSIFYIVAPKLNDYRYAVMRATRGDLIFPVLIDDYTERPGYFLKQNCSLRVDDTHVVASGDYSVSNMDQFETVFADILSSKEIQGVVNSLVTQSVNSTHTDQ